MCDLLGMSFNIPVDAEISLDVFQLRGEVNPHGWGLAFYRDGLLQIVKEPRPAVKSMLYDFIEGNPTSRTFISHVRRSTMGTISYLNTHPFYRQMNWSRGRKEFAFAHNGTLSGVKALSLNRFIPLGDTDSEHAFCHLLDSLMISEHTDWNESSFKFVETKLREINDGNNTLNCILSDGDYLLCYSDENDHNSGLRFTHRQYPFGVVDLVRHDEKLGTIDIRTIDLDKEKTKDSSGYIAVTRKLTDERWVEFKPGELIVFRNGELIYPTKRV